MDDHDQRFKALLREFLPEFVACFFPDWAARLDCAGPEWLEQEVFLDPPGGEKRILDVVAKVRNVPAAWPEPPEADHTVVHIEIESATGVANVAARMYEYHTLLRRRHKLPVLPIAVYLRVGFDGIGRGVYEDRLADWVLLRFEHLYVGLPALDGLTYHRGANLLGLALSALMRLPTAGRARLKAEGLARIARSPESDARKSLLAECFNNYLELSPTDELDFERLAAEQPPEVKEMVNSFEVSGARKGKLAILRVQLEEKFGPLPEPVSDRLALQPPERVEQIARAILTAQSLKELGLTDE